MVGVLPYRKVYPLGFKTLPCHGDVLGTVADRDVGDAVITFRIGVILSGFAMELDFNMGVGERVPIRVVNVAV